MADTDSKEAGNACMAVGDYVNAMKWYSQALTIAPRDAALHSNRSFAFLKLGLTERALAGQHGKVPWLAGFTAKADVSARGWRLGPSGEPSPRGCRRAAAAPRRLPSIANPTAFDPPGRRRRGDLSPARLGQGSLPQGRGALAGPRSRRGTAGLRRGRPPRRERHAPAVAVRRGEGAAGGAAEERAAAGGRLRADRPARAGAAPARSRRAGSGRTGRGWRGRRWGGRGRLPVAWVWRNARRGARRCGRRGRGRAAAPPAQVRVGARLPRSPSPSSNFNLYTNPSLNPNPSPEPSPAPGPNHLRRGATLPPLQSNEHFAALQMRGDTGGAGPLRSKATHTHTRTRTNGPTLCLAASLSNCRPVLPTTCDASRCSSGRLRRVRTRQERRQRPRLPVMAQARQAASQTARPAARGGGACAQRRTDAQPQCGPWARPSDTWGARVATTP